MKKIIAMIIVTAIICSVIVTGSALAGTRFNLSHKGNETDTIPSEKGTIYIVCSTSNIRKIYNCILFSDKCGNGVGRYNNENYALPYECEGCKEAFYGELSPVPASKE